MELARVVRSVAAAVTDVEAFVTELQDAGVVVELRHAPSGDLLGYKVARSGDVDAQGRPVFFSGSKLAPDLSLPRLVRGWNQLGEGADVRHPVAGAALQVERARAAVVAARRGHLGEDPDDLAPAALDVLVALRGWGEEFDHAADRFARSARAPRGVRPQPSATGAGLRRVARQLLRTRRLSPGYEPTAAGLALAVALVALITEIAAWQRESHRPHQAAAAQDSSDALGRWVARHKKTAPVVGPLPQRDRVAATQQQQRDHVAQTSIQRR